MLDPNFRPVENWDEQRKFVRQLWMLAGGLVLVSLIVAFCNFAESDYNQAAYVLFWLADKIFDPIHRIILPFVT